MSKRQVVRRTIPWPTASESDTDLHTVPTVDELKSIYAVAYRNHGRSVSGPGIEELERAAEEALQTYAKSACLSICGNATRLPRELRDEIYSYLTAESETRLIGPPRKGFYEEVFEQLKENRESTNPRGTRKRYMIRAALGWRRNWPDYAVEPEPEAEPEESFAFRMNTETPEHIWDDQYVGNQFLGEMIEQWYRTANFVMHSYNRPEPMFLDTQQVQAVMQHIPRLTIDIVDYNGLGGSHTTTPEVLDEIVDMVVLLVQGTRVGIHFHYEGSGGCVWDGGVQALERHCHFASLVVPWYQKARDAGYNVSLRIGDVDCKIVAGVSAPDDWITALRDQWQREYDLLKKWEEGEMEGLL